MLKAEIKLFIFIILLMQTDLSWIISYGVPILAGLCINTGQQVKNKTLTGRGFLVKMLYVCGLCPMVYFVYEAFNIKMDISIMLFVVTFFSDTIVTQGYKAGEVGVGNYISNIFKNSKNE